MSTSDDEYEIRLQDQRVFGAGIKRKRVQFVPSSPSTTTASSETSSASSVASKYLTLVLPSDSNGSSMNTASKPDGGSMADARNDSSTCAVCNLPLDSEPSSTSPASRKKSSDRPHEAALAHQVCLPHSQTPSHIDRRRKGLAYLQAYGWDPDARRGLGKDGRGERFPIKVKLKDDTLGLGVVLPKTVAKSLPTAPKVEKLDAGKVRKLELEEKSKRKRLQESFYRSEDVERYLYGR